MRTSHLDMMYMYILAMLLRQARLDKTIEDDVEYTTVDVQPYPVIKLGRENFSKKKAGKVLYVLSHGMYCMYCM